MKKYLAAAALSASVAGVAMAAAPAMALADDGGTTSVSGNGAADAFGNSTTAGDQSPQASLVSDSLNKLCLGVPVKANVGSLVGLLVPVAVQDVNVLSSPQNQQCADNSSQAKGDEPLSHLVEDIPVLSANGVRNG
ncbi:MULTISPECIES: rodlin [unclassified Streptomyces]|uniref:Rodlin n=1 Tax=Streptomyces evansiae TaxID=3075535 RepID=A0ABD5E303_9ACTN|nr:MULTISPECIES: rodlin [unclassified Streptomyces]ASY36357.1 RdlA protein [Streptomyces sp. CLI2509]EFK98176.1 RdlB protein [Streptomyces sp. SPB78]EGJ79167.1 putative RdlB protein [Streptomyces sp. Tu6071]MDT0409113.1 rodlin [Streptomyces sp. DSM 41979]MDT0415524.1 rodlin [Streptomyces sp. DSM 41982]